MEKIIYTLSLALFATSLFAQQPPFITDSLDQYVNVYGNEISNDNLKIYVNSILYKSNESNNLKDAVKWVDFSIKNNQNDPYLMVQNSALNYKIGNHDKAVTQMEKVIEMMTEQGNARLASYKDLLEKMKSDIKIW